MQDEFIRLQSVLNKTIVFITHDFDEAIKLADRIIIMYDGMIVQIGTAVELLTNPANDYVEEFTKNVSRGKLLPVSVIMDQADDETRLNVTVRQDERLSVIADPILASHQDARVVDEDNHVVGVLKRQKLLDALFTDGSTRN